MIVLFQPERKSQQWNHVISQSHRDVSGVTVADNTQQL